MQRLPDWRARLRTYVETSARQPFRPGRHDCALFAAGAVEAITGVDPAEGFRGAYRTLEDGFALIRDAGFADHIDMVARSFVEVPPIMAQVGDLAVVEEDALGVVQGPMVYVLRLDGIGLVSLAVAKRAFRV